MTAYPRPFGAARFADLLKQLQRRVTKLETRTAGIDSGFPLAMLPGQVDPEYSGSGDPQAYVNGAGALSGPFQYLTGSYTPAAGDQVLLAPVGVLKSYVIIGKLSG
jgi:hypothetical protein